MKCPHCLVEFHDSPKPLVLGDDVDGWWALTKQTCPSCKRMVVIFGNASVYSGERGQVEFNEFTECGLVRPRTALRPQPSKEVPKPLAEDYREASLVIGDSAKASAALSRRCLQHLLRDYAKVKKDDLSNEIQEVIDSGKLPSHIADSIDAIRHIGNFAAHPIKSKSSGEICDVVPGEAEWSLDVLEAMFDFYFVQPALLKAKRDALNKKLVDAGKPQLKASPQAMATPSLR